MVSKSPVTQNKQGLNPNIKQAEASNPLESVWVGASAGTGKTRVLTNRVLRLMLPRSGFGKASATLPHKILCLTFTKTAAAEMSARIYSDLSSWSIKSDDELRDDLRKLGLEPDNEIEEEARKLFAKVLDTPGGLKIMTIHSFCQSVLKRFPVEAGLSPHFELMDEQGATEYLNKALHDIIREAGNNPETPVANAFKLLTLHLDSTSMSELMRQVMSKRSLLKSIINHHGDNLVQKLYEELEIEQGTTEQSIIDKLKHTPEKDKFKVAIEALLQGKKTDIEKADKIAKWLEGGSNFKEYKSAFITTEDKVKKPATNDVVKIYPDIVGLFTHEAERILEASEKLVTLKQAELNEALLMLASSMLGRYEIYKANCDKLDYDDLIIKTSSLLAEKSMVPWVLYKLDSGIDHILVDEAQDTSRSQWQIVRALSEEFFEKHGSKENIIRTLFVVGDEKQSIFSFQGADPQEFDRMYKFLGDKINPVILNHSFRSTEAVLNVVDKVFSNPAAKKGVVADIATEIEHKAFREGQAGLVELWPIISPEEKTKLEPWKLPSEASTGETPDNLMAQKVASTIKGWLTHGEKLVSKDRPIKAGDVLILVQSRGEFVKLLMRALKTAGVPVAGFDRIKLADEIAIIDILALAQFALLPKDDLTLASLLKSPLVGLSEDEIYKVCYNRHTSLWVELRKQNEMAAEYLQQWIEKAGRLTPYEFFAEILNKPCVADKVSGRKAFYGRLGYDIEDAFDEFLNLALNYEQSHTPSLQGFINWFLKSTSEIKREQENSAQDAVRIMTVHGAKGLQAPIVFLPDATKKGHDHNRAKVRLLWPEDAKGIPLWASRDEFQCKLYKQKQLVEAEKKEEEYRRLLYVAMTRAEDRLYIGGWRGVRSEKEDCWYNFVASEFPAHSAKTIFEVNGKQFVNAEGHPLTALRFENSQTKAIDKVEVKEKAEVVKAALPSWVFKTAGDEPVPPKPLAPSKQDDDPAVNSPLAESESWKYNRGNIVHKLLELLPEMPKEDWKATIENYLARNLLEMPKKEQKNLADKVLAVLNHEEFAPIFGEGSRAEVPIVGIVGNKVISGKIDRLVITNNEVLIVDYKSNREPPESVEHIPVVYLKQLSLYSELIRKIYPNYNVKSALLWTEKPVLMSVNNDMIDLYRI